MLELDDSREDLTFYRQKREDGGVRTGISVGATTVLERYEPGEEDYDPSLIWSIDLRCHGEGLPALPEEARMWFLAHSSPIHAGFARYAETLAAGSDPTGAYLLEWSDFPTSPQGVKLSIVIGAQRLVDARWISRELIDVGDRWAELVGSLPNVRFATS